MYNFVVSSDAHNFIHSKGMPDAWSDVVSSISASDGAFARMLARAESLLTRYANSVADSKGYVCIQDARKAYQHKRSVTNTHGVCPVCGDTAAITELRPVDVAQTIYGPHLLCAMCADTMLAVMVVGTIGQRMKDEKNPVSLEESFEAACDVLQIACEC